jgi:hypothetical protein
MAGAEHSAVPRLVTAVALDGHLDDWPESQALELSAPERLRPEATTRWTGASDLGARLRAAWDETHVYLAIEVADDRVAAAAAGEAVGVGDALLLAADAREGGAPLRVALARRDGLSVLQGLDPRGAAAVAAGSVSHSLIRNCRPRSVRR